MSILSLAEIASELIIDPMDMNEHPTGNGGESSKARPARKRSVYLFQRLFLIDVLHDRESRPFLVWAGSMLLIGVLVYSWFEGWSWIDALYFCVITLATVGYGDLTPTTPEARLFTVFYVINGIGILLALFDRIRVVRARGRLPDSSERDYDDI